MKIQSVTPMMLKQNPDQFCFVINQLIAQVNALAAKGGEGNGNS